MLEIRAITGKRDKMRFIKMPWLVYKGDPNWVPPLIFDMKHQLDATKHPFFEFGEAAYFLAERDGVPVGRVTAHVNHKHDEHHRVRDGFFGFYECVDDVEVSNALLAKAEDWCRARGATRMIGPMSYTIYDEIAFLAEGHDNEPRTPVLLEPYTPKYYINLMAKAGYDKDIDWLAFMVGRDVKIPDLFKRVKERLISKGFTFRCINPKDLDADVERIKSVVNSAWAANWGHVPYTDAQFAAIKDALKAILDPRVIFLVEKDGETVATSITLPDINPSIKKMNGRVFPFGWWHFLRAKKKAYGLRTFLFGVKEEYRGRGIDAVLVMDTIEAGRNFGYEWSSCSLVVENNVKMIQPILDWGGYEFKRYRVFKKDL